MRHRAAGRGLGVAALVLGVVAFITLAVCGIGLVVAVPGLVVGIVAAVRDRGRGMALAGLGLSALTLVVGALLLFWFYARVQPCGHYAKGPARDRCLDRRLPFIEATPHTY